MQGRKRSRRRGSGVASSGAPSRCHSGGSRAPPYTPSPPATMPADESDWSGDDEAPVEAVDAAGDGGDAVAAPPARARRDDAPRTALKTEPPVTTVRGEG